jgi:hypothetical protein
MIATFVFLFPFASSIKKVGGYANTKMHGNVMFVGNVLCLFGLYVIYTHKESMAKAHWMTTHSMLGGALLLCCMSMGFGGAVLLHPDNGMMKTVSAVLRRE